MKKRKLRARISELEARCAYLTGLLNAERVLTANAQLRRESQYQPKSPTWKNEEVPTCSGNR